jgi:hypothetical protein
MAAYVEMPIGGDGEPGGQGETVLFEVRPGDIGGDLDLVSDDGGRQVGRVTRTIAAGLGPIRSLMETAVAELRTADPSPTEQRVDLFLRCARELGFAVARGSADASVTISATWSAAAREPTPDPAPGPEAEPDG